MKTVLKKLILKLKRIKKYKLTNEDRVELSRNKIQSAFSMFKSINEDIEKVNKELEEVIQLDTQTIVNAERNRDNASDELKANLALQKEVSKFIY